MVGRLDHARRRDLVHGLRARLSRPARSEDRSDSRVAIAGRPEVAALRDYFRRKYYLVQRVRDGAEYDGAV